MHCLFRESILKLNKVIKLLFILIFFFFGKKIVLGSIKTMASWMNPKRGSLSRVIFLGCRSIVLFCGLCISFPLLYCIILEDSLPLRKQWRSSSLLECTNFVFSSMYMKFITLALVSLVIIGKATEL